MSKRIEQVNQLLKRELSKIIFREIEFPQGILVTLTRVETSADLIQAKIYISVMPEEKNKNVKEILEKNIYQLQQKLNKRLNIRPVPRIYFAKEKETSKAGKIEEILERLRKEKK